MPNMSIDWPQIKTAFPLLGGIILAVLTGLGDVFSRLVLTGLVREQAPVKRQCHAVRVDLLKGIKML